MSPCFVSEVGEPVLPRKFLANTNHAAGTVDAVYLLRPTGEKLGQHAFAGA